MAESPLYFNPPIRTRTASPPYQSQWTHPASLFYAIPEASRRLQGLLEKFLVRVHFRETLQSPQGAGTFYPRPALFSHSIYRIGIRSLLSFSRSFFLARLFGPSDLSRFFLEPSPMPSSINACRLARGGALTKAKVIR